MKPLRIAGSFVGGFALLAMLAASVLYAMFDGEKIKSELSRVVMEKTQRRLEIVGPVELSLWPNVGVRLGRTTLSEHASPQEFLAFDAARVAVAVLPLLSKQVAVSGIELQGLKATLVKRGDGTLNISDLASGAVPKKVGAEETVATPLQIDVARIKLANAQLTWRDETTGSVTTLSDLNFSTGHLAADSGKKTLTIDSLLLATHGKTGTDAFDLKLEAPRLNLTPEKTSGESLSLFATLSDAGRTVGVRLILSGIEGTTEALKIAQFVLDLDAQNGAVMLTGHLASPAAVNLAAQTIGLEKIAGSLDIAHPAMPMKRIKLPLSGRAHVDLAQQVAALNLDTQFDESKIAARLDVAKFTPLALNFDLAIDRLDVDKYLPPQPAQEKTAKDAALDFSALKNLNLAGAIRIGSLQVAKLKFANLNARLKAAGGRLDIAPFAANLYQGTTSGSASVDANGNALHVRQTLAGVSINPLLQDLVDKDMLEGRGSVVLDVTGHGATTMALKKSLAGSASLSLHDGAVKGINLAQTLRDIKARLGAKRDVTQQARATEKTDFSELTASFHITGGVAYNEDLALKSPFLRLGGAGNIDIGNGQIDYLAKASVVNTGAGQEGKELAQLKGITVPMRVTGPFDEISWKIEFGSMAADVVKEKMQAKMDEKQQEIQQKASDKVKEKLKGLFGK